MGHKSNAGTEFGVKSSWIEANICEVLEIDKALKSLVGFDEFVIVVANMMMIVLVLLLVKKIEDKGLVSSFLLYILNHDLAIA